MRQLLKILFKTIDVVSTTTGWIAALSLVCAALVVTQAVVVRKILDISTIWQTEAAIYMLIFTVFAGAAFVQKNEHHLNVDLVLMYLAPKTRERTLIVVSILTCLLTGIIAWYSWPMWWQALIENEHSESLWGPPLWIPLFFLPFGMTLLCLQYIVYIKNKISDFKEGRISEQAERLELRDIEID